VPRPEDDRGGVGRHVKKTPARPREMPDRVAEAAAQAHQPAGDVVFQLIGG